MLHLFACQPRTADIRVVRQLCLQVCQLCRAQVVGDQCVADINRNPFGQRLIFQRRTLTGNLVITLGFDTAVLLLQKIISQGMMALLS